MTTGSVGAVEGYLASSPPVIGFGFGGCGDWSREVDTLIGQIADIASAVPERLGCGRLLSWADAGSRAVCPLGAVSASWGDPP